VGDLPHKSIPSRSRGFGLRGPVRRKIREFLHSIESRKQAASRPRPPLPRPSLPTGVGAPAPADLRSLTRFITHADCTRRLAICRQCNSRSDTVSGLKCVQSEGIHSRVDQAQLSKSTGAGCVSRRRDGATPSVLPAIRRILQYGNASGDCRAETARGPGAGRHAPCDHACARVRR
jgi:hypothetical protein